MDSFDLVKYHVRCSIRAAIAETKPQRPSFAVGTFDGLPSDTEAILHKSEMVVPATFSESIRRGDAVLGTPDSLGVGSGEMSVNVILDSKVLAKATAKEFNNGVFTLDARRAIRN